MNNNLLFSFILITFVHFELINIQRKSLIKKENDFKYIVMYFQLGRIPIVSLLFQLPRIYIYLSICTNLTIDLLLWKYNFY